MYQVGNLTVHGAIILRRDDLREPSGLLRPVSLWPSAIQEYLMNALRIAALFIGLAAGAAFAAPVTLTNGGDMFVAGSTVSTTLTATRDVLAAGGSVDLTARGGTVRTAAAAMVAGNARVLGGLLTIDGAVMGALVNTMTVRSGPALNAALQPVPAVNPRNG